MAMRLLLDAHLPHALAEALRRQDIDAVTLAEWHDGQYLCASDDLILTQAYEDGRVLVSCDCRTIPPLLVELTSTGQHHAGVVLVSLRSRLPRTNMLAHLFPRVSYSLSIVLLAHFCHGPSVQTSSVSLVFRHWS
ncbi:MAG: hypothetical protein EPO21_19115 [Chloroflexota bacterium]|nr:MAG: hypothetical protein EPO21_19115 [Chloroflexota bacterium]